MSRSNSKKKLGTSESKAPPFKITLIKEGNIHFRFDYFNAEHPLFKSSQFNNNWAKNLLTRLKRFQQVTIDQFRKDMSFRQSQYVHEIKWENANVDTFGIHRGAEYDLDAWQFGLSKANGRIHGFFIGDIFYIVWLDPEHKLFDYDKPN